MANEITIQAVLTQANATAGKTTSAQFSPGAVKVNQTGHNVVHESMDLTTSPAPIPIGSIGTLGLVLIENLDTANTVLLRLGAGGADVIKILPGETSGPFRFNGSNPYASAAAATATIEYLACEN